MTRILPPPGTTVLARFPSREEAEGLTFTLGHAGVLAGVLWPGSADEAGEPAWEVWVSREHLARAREILAEEGLAARAARPVPATPGSGGNGDSRKQAPLVSLPVPASGRAGRAGLAVIGGLVLANLAVFLAMERSGGSEQRQVLLRFGASFAPSILRGDWWRTVTAVFVHIGARHLLANLVTLLVLGPAVLGQWGAGRFLFMYLVCGLAGNWLSFALAPSMAVKAGASGAILGLLGVLAGTRIRQIRRPAWPSRLKTWHVLAMLLAFYGFVVGVGPSDHLAHLGGLLCGALLALVLPPPQALSPRADRIWALGLGLASLALCALAGLLAV